MTAVIVTGIKDEAVLGRRVDTCGSTPSMRTGLLDVVWTASARVESLQWEMDEAEESLARAMRSAVATGAGLPDLAIASGMSFAAVERLLKEEPTPEIA